MIAAPDWGRLDTRQQTKAQLISVLFSLPSTDSYSDKCQSMRTFLKTASTSSKSGFRSDPKRFHLWFKYHTVPLIWRATTGQNCKNAINATPDCRGSKPTIVLIRESNCNSNSSHCRGTPLWQFSPRFHVSKFDFGIQWFF